MLSCELATTLLSSISMKESSMTTPIEFQPGQRIHVDTDHPDWGHVCTEAIIIDIDIFDEKGKESSEVLIKAQGIIPNILVPLGDISLADLDLDLSTVKDLCLYSSNTVKDSCGNLTGIVKPKSYPYTLRLTKLERDAIDFVDNRYSHGHDLFLLLCQADWWPEVNDVSYGDDSEDVSWESDEDIEFMFEEWLAWNARSLLEFSDYELFGDGLKRKFLEFLDGII